MLRRLMLFGFVLAGMTAMMGCQYIVAVPVYTAASVASSRIVDYERSDEMTQLLVGHVPIVKEFDDDDREAEVPILTVLRVESERNAKVRNSVLETFLVSLYRMETDGKNIEASLLEFPLLRMALKRHWSAFSFKRDEDGIEYGLLYFFEFKDKTMGGHQ